MTRMEFNVRDVLDLIRSSVEKQDVYFRMAARSIAKELRENGRSDLEHYVLGLIGDEPVIVPQSKEKENILTNQRRTKNENQKSIY